MMQSHAPAPPYPIRRRWGVGSTETSLVQAVRTHPKRWEAGALIVGGVGSALYLLLSFHGYRHTAAALGLFGAISAATYGAIRILSTPEG